ncbi:putative ferric-chelate reductase 1 homolog [Ischnura elegans]|uniref:putative ferric-chelate reductase 1 homolog n=1 Tax=Ischnura elegans TaxID=197161 RepID=UPI001ED8941F|nr:putative ferric-chelate reductase 1 homolog [Ischnura elegans]
MVSFSGKLPTVGGPLALALLSVAVLVLSVGPLGVGGFSMGAPDSVCGSLVPGHKAQASPHPSKFRLSLAAPMKNNKTVGNSKDRVIRVRIHSPDRIPFKGFILRAQEGGSNSPIGSFTFEDPTKAKTMSCGNAIANAVTHPDAKPKYFVDVDWHAPEDYGGIVLFNATVVQNYSTFWVGIVSDKVKIIPPTTGTRQPKETTVPAAVTQSSPIDLSPRISEEITKLYDGCAITKLCFGMPDNCVQDGSCHTLVTILATGTQFEFEMLAKPLQGEVRYVAVGLSSDKDMGDDSVTECELGTNSAVNLYTSYNNGKSNKRSPNKNGVSLISSSYEDQVMQCKFTREPVTVAGEKTYDLINTPYHILLAAGDSLKPDSVGYHLSRRAYSENPQLLSVVDEIKGASKLLLHLHGAFMIAAWLLCASTGILLARYFKKTWTGHQTCGKDQWFAWHRCLMILTWGLTIAAFVIIFVEIGEWSSSAGTHAILGTITTALAFIQPFMAAFRPAPSGKRRPLFNWAHWFVGNAAHILAVVTIFFAVKLVKAELPTWMDWMLVAYVAFYVFMHLIFSISGCLSERENTKRVNTFAMKDLSSSRSPLEMSDRNMDAPYAGLRKVLLAVYIIVILALTIALIVIIALAPIEQNWERVTKVFKQS